LSVIYARTIAEPTSVRDLLSGLIEQSAIALWWDDLARLIRLQVLREIATDAAVFDAETIVDGSLQVKEQPGKRISQIWSYYAQRDPTDQADKADNYAAALATVDLARQGDYGSPEIRKIFGAWVPTVTAAERLNGIQMSRFRDPPRRFSFSLFQDQVVSLGAGYRIGWWANQDEDGFPLLAPVQVTRLRVEADLIHVEAEEMLASGVITVTNTVFLRSTGAVLQWPVPASWNNAENAIHVLAGGGGGGANGVNGGKGGGGGAYSGVSNMTLTPGALIPYRIGDGGTVGGHGGDSWFGAASYAASIVAARGGQAGDGRVEGGAGGQAVEGIGTVRTSGGNGGNGAPRGESRAGGGGAGGAGGPSGNGGHGGSLGGTGQDGGAGGGGADGGFNGGGSSGGSGAGGGNDRFSFGGGNSSQPNGVQGGGGRGGDSNSQSAGAGGNGQQLWTQSVAPIIAAGPGGGGGGGGNNNSGRPGGLYGGGGGGAGGAGAPAAGAQGIIVITWREAS
jgi:hypothetical protein